MNEVQTLSSDINVITAEINTYQRVAGEAIFEIGKRLKHVKENDLAHGEFGKWLKESVNFTDRQARRFMQVAEEFKTDDVVRIGSSKVFELLQLPSEIDRQQFVEQPHTIPSTGETKTVDEMTVRELREVKAELKRKDAMLAEKERSEEILTRQNERLTDELASVTKPKEVVVEKEVEKVVEVDKTDYSVVERLRAYEERFGALENYSDRVRATNISDATTAIVSFNMAVRDFIKRHAFLIKYNDTIRYVDRVTQREYNEAVQALKEISADFSKVTGIGDFVDVEYTEVQQ